MANFNVKEGLSIQGTEIVDENRVVKNATLNAANSVTFQNIPNSGLVNDGLTVNGYDIDLGGSQTLDTDDIQESGSPTNIYFTTARARATVSVNQPSGDGTLAYNNGTGVFTYTGPSAAETRVHFSATSASGVTYDSNTGVFALASIPNSSITNAEITINGIATSLGGARTLFTDDVAEDPSPTNKYFTDARARAAVSVTPNTGLSYNGSTGVFELASIPNSSLTYPYFTINNTQVQLGQSVGFPNQFTDDVVEDANPTNLYFTQARARASFSGGTGVTYDEPTGEFSIGQAVETNSNVQFNDLQVDGNLTVSGTTTYINTETIELDDNTILLNANATTASEDAGIEVERGTVETNVTFLWDETADKWTIGTETFVAGTVEADLTGDVTGTVSSIANHDTDALTQGSTNLYYASSLFDTDLATKTTDDLTEGSTNLYYASTLFDADLATKTTDNLTEGTNEYYTNAKADARVNLQTGTNLDLSQKTTDDLTQGSTNLYYASSLFDTDFSGKSTDDLSEGLTNKYYTSTLFDADLATKTTDNLTEGSTNLYYSSSLFDTDLATKTTDDLTEGSTNLYYTSTLFDADLATKTTDNLTQGSTNLYYTSTLFDADLATKTTDNLTEGSTNLYLTLDKVHDPLNDAFLQLEAMLIQLSVSSTVTLNLSGDPTPGDVLTLDNGTLTAGSNYADATGLSTTGGNGTGLTVDIVTDGAGSITAVTIAAGGSGYSVGDTITIVQPVGLDGLNPGTGGTIDTLTVKEMSTGQTVTGATSASTGVITSVGATSVTVDNVTGFFRTGEIISNGVVTDLTLSSFS
jgi:uncharacterized protein YjgD (DUF1641 family)